MHCSSSSISSHPVPSCSSHVHVHGADEIRNGSGFENLTERKSCFLPAQICQSQTHFLSNSRIISLTEKMKTLRISPQREAVLAHKLPIKNPDTIVVQTPTLITLHNTILDCLPPDIRQLIFSYSTPQISSTHSLHTFISHYPRIAQEMVRPILQSYINALPEPTIYRASTVKPQLPSSLAIIQCVHSLCHRSRHLNKYIRIVHRLLLQESDAPFDNSHKISLRLDGKVWDSASIAKLGKLFPNILFLGFQNIAALDTQRLCTCAALFRNVHWIKFEQCRFTSADSVQTIARWSHLICLELSRNKGLSDIGIWNLLHTHNPQQPPSLVEVSLIAAEPLSIHSCTALFHNTLRAHISVSPLKTAGFSLLFKAAPQLQALYVDTRNEQQFKSLCEALSAVQCIGLLPQLKELMIYGGYSEQIKEPFSLGDAEIEHLVKMIRPIETIGFIDCFALTNKGVAILQTAWKNRVKQIITHNCPQVGNRS